jgi:hypothetical protein
MEAYILLKHSRQVDFSCLNSRLYKQCKSCDETDLRVLYVMGIWKEEWTPWWRKDQPNGSVMAANVLFKEML